MFGVVPLTLAGIALGFVLGTLLMAVRLPLEVFWLLFAVIGLVGLWSWICIGSRRLHDFNQSGWWMLLVIALPVGIYFAAPGPVAKLSSLVFTAILGLVPGTVGANTFGADPNARAASTSGEVNVRSNTSLERTREG
jgi:uncharacterized membrane protein YhaH (DUF805 family)